MKSILKTLLPAIPLLIIYDVKIPLTPELNLGFKDLFILFLAIAVMKKSTIILLFSNKNILLFSIFLMSSYLANFALDNLHNSLMELLRMTESLILAISVNYFLRYHPISLLLKSFIISGMILAVQIYFETFFPIYDINQLGGIAGMWLSICTFILYFNFKTLTWPKTIKFLILIALIIGNFLCDRRTWIFLSLAIILLHFFRRLSVNKILLLSLFLLMSLIFPALLFGFILNNERISSLLPAVLELDLNSVMASRLHRWEVSIEILSENIILGVGYGNIDLQLPSWVNTDNPDNQYFDVWLQNGLIAFLSFLAILFLGLKKRNSFFKNESNVLNSSFALLILGGMTWAFIAGYGILIFSFLVGTASFYHPYFRKKDLNFN